MGDFNRGNRSGSSRQGERDFGRRSFGNDRDRDRQMFKVTCSNCGKECEVPFRPTGGRPVYCSDCFRTMGGPDSRNNDDRGPRRPSFDNRDRDRRPIQQSQPQQPQYREQFESLNAKLDKILKILTAPVVSREETPVVKEEKIAKEVEVLKLEEQPAIPKKKKRAPKKSSF